MSSILPGLSRQHLFNNSNSRRRSPPQAPAAIIDVPRAPDPVHVHRAASYTYFPQHKDRSLEDGTIIELKGTVSEEELGLTDHDDGDEGLSMPIRYSSSRPRNGPANPSNLDYRRPERPFSNGTTPAPRVLPDGPLLRVPTDPRGANGVPSVATETGATDTTRPSARSANKLRRKSWMLSSKDADTKSRSPSPSTKRRVQKAQKEQTIAEEPSSSGGGWSFGAGRRKSLTRSKRNSTMPPEGNQVSDLFPKGVTTPPKARRPMSELILGTGGGLSLGMNFDSSPKAKGPSLRKSFSSDVLHRSQKPRHIDPVPQIPRNWSSEWIQGTSEMSTRPMSELILASPFEERSEPPLPKPHRSVQNLESPGLPKSYSVDTLPHLPRYPSAERVPSVPRLSMEQYRNAKSDKPKRRDELWTAFRNLEGDYQKFNSKSIALKANVVRASLLPFLRQYRSHPSDHKLRAEDLDRRINILNKWWTGLLEMLNSPIQSISGTDRPAILDGVSGIMERPEWRLYPSPFCAIPDRVPSLDSSRSRSASSTSLASEDGNFLEASVQHNVRNIFIQKLTAQMAFVVDKMSMRQAPASLVSFCGKTCAYAFYFCPMIPDVLVRLWEPTIDTMRRVLNELNMPKRSEVTEVSSRISHNFPPAVRSLRFNTLASVVRDLKMEAKPPLGTEKINWQGPWMNRWAGKDSDLFYVFVKHYHILLHDFLPSETSRAHRICAPGLLLVYAQILANLDSTIHRHSVSSKGSDESLNGPSSVTFDDLLGNDPDAAAPAIPMAPAANSHRVMSENRLVMLIREFLSDRSSTYPTSRHIFAEAISGILKAAASKTSIYDHSACYTLCDFLEEAAVILIRYDQSSQSKETVLDWPFWLDVCKRMVKSHNTTTEIRLYAFLYTVWGSLALDQSRKYDLCHNFLLEPEFFESRFNHWCPMVRAYYMRLVCWRIGRHDGEVSGMELDLYRELTNRLRSVWSHFLYARDVAHATHSIQPSTAPCNPAPGRRLLIIRTDPSLAGKGSFLSFDGLGERNPASSSNALKRLSSLAQLPDPRPLSARSGSDSSDSSDYGDTSNSPEDSGKKKWGLFKSIISTSKSRSKSSSPARSPDRQAATSTDNSNNKTIPRSTASGKPDAPSQPHRAFCFKFSLEWVDRRFQTPGNMRLQPPRLPWPAQQAMQAISNHSPNSSTSELWRVESLHEHLLHGSGAPPDFWGKGQQRDYEAIEPVGAAKASSKYSGRALAEWAIVVNECQNFFERRRSEGVPSNRAVETPTLGVEAFKRPG